MVAIATIDPTTGEVLEELAPMSDAEVDRRLTRAEAAFARHRQAGFSERAEWMVAVADILDADAEAEALARTMTTEMGKTLSAARAEVGKCAAAARYYAERAEGFLADEPLQDPTAVKAEAAWARYQPLGPVLAVMPWNFPMWQVLRFAVPALMAGNVGLLKHASNVPRTALAIEDLFLRAGFPEGCFQTLLIGNDRIEDLLADPRVRAATLTGSVAAGRAVAQAAGRNLKTTVLELGGSDPFIVMPSADLARAAEVAVTARCQNNGQSCIAAKRFIVHEAVADEWEELFVKGMAAQVVGHPTEEDTDIGPLATERGRDDVTELVDDAVGKGATVRCGGRRPAGPGWWYPPTVLTDVTAGMRVFSEEVFGPVAQVHRVADLDAAIALANATEFGLGANAWTSDPDERRRLIDELDAGMVAIDGMVTSYPELPFGGVRSSGYGRELSAHGIREFCNLKTVWVGPSPAG